MLKQFAIVTGDETLIRGFYTMEDASRELHETPELAEDPDAYLVELCPLHPTHPAAYCAACHEED